MDEILIFGHRNPDTDSMVSASALSYLKNALGQPARPYRLGEANKETQFVYDYFQVDLPDRLDNVRPQVSDLDYQRVVPMERHHSIAHAYRHMQAYGVRTLPIINSAHLLKGVMTMHDVAMSLIQGDADNVRITSTYRNMLYAIDGRAFTRAKEQIDGEITVTAYHTQTIIDEKILHEKSIVLVGDRHEIILHAIELGVELIVVTGGKRLPDHIKAKALANKVNIIVTDYDTFRTSKLVTLANKISSIMTQEDLVRIVDTRYLEDVRDILEKSQHSKFPVVAEDNRYQGILSRRNVLKPKRKRVIMVDHNEFHQSARGIEQALILEIVDHHKIGNITTQLPINFRNETVGSTSTILVDIFRENSVKIPDHIAGLLLAGILSDTLMFKSPTTTQQDRDNAYALESSLDLDMLDFGRKMFQRGTSIQGMDQEEIFYNDYKSFNYKKISLGISQFFTLDIDVLQTRQTEILAMMNQAKKDHHLQMVLVVYTDILKEGSYLFYVADNERILKEAFSLDALHQGVFIPQLISRKKQLLPKVMDAIDLYQEGLL